MESLALIAIGIRTSSNRSSNLCMIYIDISISGIIPAKWASKYCVLMANEIPELFYFR